MNRGALFGALVAIAPAAGAAAWIPCEQPGMEAPIPLYLEAPGYPPAVREIAEGLVEFPPPAYRPPPRVTRTMKGPAAATTG
jgi:hypothetical protein